MYRSEPYHVAGFMNTRDHGWVLIEHSDGSKRFVKPRDLHVVERDEEAERKWR